LKVGISAAALAAAFSTCAAFAAAKHGGVSLPGNGEAVLIAEIVLLLLIGRGLGELMQRMGQPSVIGQLLAGLILGPSLFGWIWPHGHLQIFPGATEQKNLIAGISNVGVMLLLLLTGMETDLKLVRRVGAPAFAVTAAGVLVPFACGFILGQWLPESILADPAHRLAASLFLGTALSISSIKIVAMVVREMNFMRRNLGQIIVASSIMEDTIGWVIIALTLGLATSSKFSPLSLIGTLAGTVAFLVLSYTIGRRLVFWLIRWVNDTFVSEYAVVTAILIVMFLMALVTQQIGVNTVLGAFVAGVLVGESPILTQHISDQLRGFITAFMMPIFFGLSGLSADLTILKDPSLLVLTFGFVAVASLGKFSGAFVGGRLSGLSLRESLALGCAMNARGSTEIIVASIGLTTGILTQKLYTLIVTMAVLTTMAMPPMLRWALRRVPLRPEEKERLEHETLDSRGFISNLERLLISADKSASGELVTRLAGLIAGRRGLPITVVEVDRARASAQSQRSSELKDVAIAGAKEGRRAAADQAGEPSDAGHVNVLSRAEARVDEAVEKEGAKGYDLLLVGLEKVLTPTGAFTREFERAARGFEGPLAIVMAGKNADALRRKRLNVLVPANGTEPSRRGAEFAFAIAPPGKGAVTALHVADSAASDGKRRRRTQRGERRESAVLDDVVRLAARYGHDEIGCAVHTDVAPAEAILEEAKRSKINLIVIGATRRSGERLYLGQTIATILDSWDGALVLVVSA
jgi:Kef-type K+ transport system membrane component KefB/nucleotide-binding universal stress UspA family protein